MTWTQQEAINLCVLIEQIVPTYGAHVALTGGSLYKHGPRKDADILFYRIRQQKQIRMAEMWKALREIGFDQHSGWGWCYKATFNGKPVDCFFPEAERGPDGEEIEYSSGEPAPASKIPPPELPDEDISF